MMRPAATSTTSTTKLPTPPDGSSRFSILVYAHTHWDREWYQPFERFRMMLVHAVDRILDTLEAEPAFTTYVLDGQTIVLDDYLAIRPEARPRIERLVRAGRLEVGPWYILPDEFLVSGESLVRNLLEGRRGARAFGSELAVGYLPDPFGHVAQLPAVLAGFGIDSIVFSRGMGNEYAGLGPTFRWLAADLVTGITAVVQTSTYTNGYCNAELLSKPRTATDDARIVPGLEAAVGLATHLAEEANTGTLVFAAGCDHETINPQLPQLLDQLTGRIDGADIAISGLAGIIASIESSVAERASRGETLAEYSGELRGSWHAPILAAIFSARIALKQDNVRLQTRLERCIEPLVALAGAGGVWRTDTALLRHAWKLALQNQPHDSIGGCSVDSTHLDMPPRTRAAHQVCDSLVEDVLAALGQHERDLVSNTAATSAGGIVNRVVYGGSAHAVGAVAEGVTADTSVGDVTDVTDTFGEVM
ncbi:MAG: hypothetical protein H7123_08855, partial [Thermoleophilia bacterium]|nr:hypothetical protein [Thermoleophilia bacterium]